MRNFVSICILLALPAGCAYQQALKHGEGAAATQNWIGSYDAYRFANELKPGKADGVLAEARDKAIAAELQAAAAAVTAKDYVKADTHIDSAERLAPSVPDARITEAQDAARVALLAELATRMSAVKNLDEAYGFVALAKGLQPHSPEVEDAATSLRSRVEADTKAQLASSSFAEARETARLMARLEPAQRTRGTALEKEVADAWVASLVEKAKAAERTRPGLAAVYWSRAHEVGGDAANATAAATAVTAAEAMAPMQVFVDSQGGGARHARLRNTVRTTATALPSVGTGTAAKTDLTATIVASDERCAETSVKKPLEKEYQSGTKQVPNPAHAEISTQLTTAEADVKTVTAEVDKQRTAHTKAAATAKALTADQVGLKKTSDEAAATLAATVSQVTASGERVAEAEKELAALGSAGDPITVAQVSKQLGLVKGFHEEWKSKKVVDQGAADTAKAALDKVDAELVPAKKAEADTSAALMDGEARLAAAKTKVTELATKRNATPKTLTENVMSIAKYTETTWTLTCDGPASVKYATNWTTARSKAQKVESKVETTDVEVPANKAAGIEADPKAFPKAKADVIAEVDAAVHKAIAAEVEAFVAESFAKQLETALAAATDVETATQELVSLCAGAPERVDAATRAKVAAFLKEHYGLENAAPLKIPAAAEKVPPAAAPAAETAAAPAPATGGSPAAAPAGSPPATKEAPPAPKEAPAPTKEAPAPTKGG